LLILPIKICNIRIQKGCPSPSLMFVEHEKPWKEIIKQSYSREQNNLIDSMK
jgi:hypothetical protein